MRCYKKARESRNASGVRLSECRDSSRHRSKGKRPKIAGEMTFKDPVKYLFILKIDIFFFLLRLKIDIDIDII